MLSVVCWGNVDVCVVCVWLLLCEDVSCCTVFGVELLQGVPTTYCAAAAAAAPQNAAVFQSKDTFLKLILKEYICVYPLRIPSRTLADGEDKGNTRDEGTHSLR